MTVTSEARRAVRDTIRELGGIDIVVANAVCGVFGLGSCAAADVSWVGLDALLGLEGSGFDE